MKVFFEHGVFEEDRQGIQAVFNQSYLFTHLKAGSSITRLYRTDQGIYAEIKAVRSGEYSVLFGFTNKDKEVIEQQEHLYMDSLTRIKNRRYYDERLAAQTCQAVAMSDIPSCG